MVQTKRAIQTSFLKLAEQKPLDKITVREIVEDCGINRNSFYYHFEDLPDLIEKTISSQLADPGPGLQTDSMLEVILRTFTTIEKNRDFYRKVYLSKNRDVLESRMYRLGEKLMGQALESRVFSKTDIPKEDQIVLVRAYKNFVIGYILDWFNSGMKYDLKKDFIRVWQLRLGGMDKVLASTSIHNPLFNG